MMHLAFAFHFQITQKQWMDITFVIDWYHYVCFVSCLCTSIFTFFISFPPFVQVCYLTEVKTEIYYCLFISKARFFVDDVYILFLYSEFHLFLCSTVSLKVLTLFSMKATIKMPGMCCWRTNDSVTNRKGGGVVCVCMGQGKPIYGVFFLSNYKSARL